MMVLNEPETSLHPDLLPALADLIIKATENRQIWIVTHSPALISGLQRGAGAKVIELQKALGQTEVAGQSPSDGPLWRWIE